MFYSYTRSEHKNMFVRFSIHQINAPSSLSYLSKFITEKETWGYAKFIHEKRELRKKIDTKVSEIFKTVGTQMSV